MWVGFILTGLCLLSLASKVSSSPGTTPNIENIFIGRCWEYLNIRKTQLNPPSVTNCTELWTTFSAAWIRKDPKTITENDYLLFFNAVKQQNIEKILLWSGTYDIAHEYSRHVSYYVTLEDSFLGYLVNGLTWCGIDCSQCPGINYTACPEKLPSEAGRAFWGGASRTFASSLKESGLVQLMLNGSHLLRPAYDQNSFFSLYELPNLPKSANIITILVHDVERTPREHCNTGSLVILKEKLESLNFKFECVENPPAVVHLLCADFPLRKECFFKNKAMINCGTNSVTSVLKLLCLFITFHVFTSL